jgi:flagellar protein FlgJ
VLSHEWAVLVPAVCQKSGKGQVVLADKDAMDTTISPEILLQNGDTTRARDLAAAGTANRERKAAKRVAQEFEALFIGMMLKSMRETVGKDQLTGGGRGEEIFRSLLDQEYATSFAARGGVGLAPLIEQELVKQAARRSGSTEAPKPAVDVDVPPKAAALKVTNNED